MGQGIFIFVSISSSVSKTSLTLMIAYMVSIISPVFPERKPWLPEVERFHKALPVSSSAEIQTLVSLTPNSVLFPPNCSIKTKEI